MKYLGIDFGTKNIGLAISDGGGILAFPYRQLVNTKNTLAEIAQIVTTEGVGHIIIGYSSDSQGRENSVMEHVHSFKKSLEDTTAVPVSFQKEFMSSVFARQDFHGKEKNNARQTKRPQAKPDDVAAAILILQRYLDGVKK